MNKNILWLTSWYPNQLGPFEGDFIQRHARAASLFQQLTILHIKKDDKGIVTKNMKEVVYKSKNLTEIVIYYHPFKTGIFFIDKFLSHLKYIKIYKRSLINIIKKYGRPDLVHVHVALKAGQQALWLKRKFKIPFILSEHWSGYFEENKFNVQHLNPIQKKVLLEIFNNADRLVVVSNILGKAITGFFWKKKFDVIYNTVDTNIFFPVKNENQVVPSFIHISSLNYEKNVDKIIEAFFLLKEKNLKFHLVIYGPYNKALQTKVAQNSLQENVFFKTEVPQTELAIGLQKADALILFSHYETFGCVVIEASACGVPAILSNLPVFKEYTRENVNCIFANSNSAADLALKLENFILKKYNFNKEQIAIEARNKFGFPVIGKQLADLYI